MSAWSTTFRDRVWFCIIALSALIAAPVAAQSVSQTQQCVWQCLYGPGNGNNTSPAYHSCVAQHCSAAQAPQPPVADPTRHWVSGRTSNGVGYAGVDGVRGRTGVYMFCYRGQSWLRVIGGSGIAATLLLRVDNVQFPLDFQPNPQNFLETVLPYTSNVVEALRNGHRVQVITYQGQVLVDATLNGAGRSLSDLISGC